MKFDSIKVGDTLYDLVKRKMGNTTMSTLEVVTIEILDIDLESAGSF